MKKREKGFWIKQKEKYTDAEKAKNRAGSLRTYASNQIAHVCIDKVDGLTILSYSIATWFKQECDRAKVSI